MVTNSLIIQERFKEAAKKTNYIRPEYANLFAERIYDWYRATVTERLYGGRADRLPPNLFQLTQYSNRYYNAIVDVFIASETGRHAHEGDKPIAVAFGQSMDFFKDNYIHEYIEYDIEVFLNAANLFYCYKDDASDKITFRNMFAVEVW